MSEQLTANGPSPTISRIILRPRASAPRSARRLVRQTCAASTTPARVMDDATLLASELVTDRLKQARVPLDVVVEADPRGVTIRVSDHEPYRGPAASGSRRTRELMHRLATTWGYGHGQHGWVAWASLRTPGG